MEIANQIKKYRNEKGYSQEELSERIFVSRQTISSWENGKSYPDIKSLLILSDIFNVSLENLVKGDVEKMKEIVKETDVKKSKENSNIFFIFLVCLILLTDPVLMLKKISGYVVYAVFIIITFYYGFKVEKQKKELNIRTFKEIVAFMEGKAITKREEKFNKNDLIKIFGIIIALSLICIRGLSNL